MKQRVWLVPSKSFQKAWSPSQVREAISLGPIFHFWFLLLRASADSLVIAIGKCDLWKNEACCSTDRVYRCFSPALPFPMAEMALYNSSLLFQSWCQKQHIPQALGRVLSDCPIQGLTHKEESCLLSIHLFPFLKFSKFNQPEQICVIIFELMVLEFS